MIDKVLEILEEEIQRIVTEIHALPIDNTQPNTKLHFLTVELGTLQTIKNRIKSELL